MSYTRDGDRIDNTYFPVDGGIPVQVTAHNIYKGRTGTHATVSILVEDRLLAYSLINFDRDDERGRLARTAQRRMQPLEAEYWKEETIRTALDKFCAGLWREYVGRMVGELMAGNPEIGPPKRLCGPYIVQGGGTIMYAPPGRGKSYMALITAVSMDAGCDLVWPVQQRRTLFVNLERSRDSMQHRLACVNRALGLDPARPLPFLNARGRSLAEIEEGVRRTIQEHEIDVLVLDSISRAGMGDLIEGSTANRVVDLLNGLCPTWLAIAHTPRADESHVYGSVFFEAGQDIGVRLVSQSMDGMTGIGLDVTKANDLPKPPMSIYALEWGLDGLKAIRSARRYEFPEIEAGNAVSLAQQIEEYLLQVGKAGGTDIAREIARSRQNVSATLKGDPRFGVVEKRGSVVLYGVTTPQERDTSHDTSRVS